MFICSFNHRCIVLCIHHNCPNIIKDHQKSSKLMQRSSPHDGKTLRRAAVVVCGRMTQGRQQKSAARPRELKWPAENRLNAGGSGSFPEGKPCPVRLVPPLDDRGAVRHTDRNRIICYRPGGSYTACHPPPIYNRLLTISAQIPYP